MFVPPSNMFLLFLYLIYLEPDSTLKLHVFWSGFLLGLLIPIIFFIFLQKIGKVDDVDAQKREQRTTPYLFGIFLCSLAVIWMELIYAPQFYSNLWIAYIFNSIFILIINKYWKISAHALGVSAPVAVLFFLNGFSALPWLLAIIIIAWSRLVLKMHTPAQLIAGSLLGLINTYLILYILS